MHVPPSLVRAALAALLALPLAACRGDAPPRAEGDARRYTVRGEVVRVAGTELSVRHEAIPDFADRSGARVGMAAMVMPFAVAKDVPLDAIAAGDKIRFTFVVDWAANRMEIEALEELPPETPLQFGR